MLRNSITLAMFCVLAFACEFSVAIDPPPGKQITLLSMLSEWQYPDSTFGGANMSDAGVADISSIKCKAALTTPDSAEKVLAYYQKLLNVDASGNNLGRQGGERVKTNRSVSIQDNSDGRPLKLYIIAINEKNLSINLVISRSDGEDTTHIAWSNYRQIYP